MIIGWSLVNNSVLNEVFEFSKQKVNFFKNNGIIEPNVNVALGLQWLIDNPYQGKGVIQKLYFHLEALMKNKYDIVEASVRKNNPAGNAATDKIGMIKIFEDELRVYKIRVIDNPSNKLKGTTVYDIEGIPVAIRTAEIGDEEQLHQLNKLWTKEVIGDDTSKGFLTSLYSTEEFRKIISVGEIAVAEIQTQKTK